MVDTDAVDPQTKVLMSILQGFNSPCHCYHFICVIGKETTDLLNERMRSIYMEINALGIKNNESTSCNRLGLKPLNISNPADMSGHWKAIGSGGAAKVKTQFCNCWSFNHVK